MIRSGLTGPGSPSGRASLRLARTAALTRVVIHRTLQGFMGERGYDLASGLAYASLLSFVPLVASVTILTSSLFGSSGSGLLSLIHGIVPAASSDVMTGIEGFAAKARTASSLASIFLVLTSLRLFLLLEGSVNALWGTTVQRRPLMWLGTALAVVLLGPVTAGVLTSFVLESGAPIAEFRFTGLVVTSLLLTLLYHTVPSATVRWAPAAAAGFAAGAGVTLLKIGFTKGVVALASISRIYGSVSAVIIFVIAIGFVWDILLLGVSFAHAVQFRDELLAHDEPEREAKRSAPLDEAIRLLSVLASARQRGTTEGADIPLEVLSDEIRRPEDDTEARLSRLVAADLVLASVTKGANGDDGRRAISYRLSRPPEEISLFAIARAMGELGPRPLPRGGDAAAAILRKIYRRTDREVRHVLQGTSLSDLERSASPRSQVDPA